jgi:hypothetical protein
MKINDDDWEMNVENEGGKKSNGGEWDSTIVVNNNGEIVEIELTINGSDGRTCENENILKVPEYFWNFFNFEWSI